MNIVVGHTLNYIYDFAFDSRHYTGSLQYYIVRHYGRAILYDTRYLFQALPRLLMIWMDFGQSILEPPNSKDM